MITNTGIMQVAKAVLAGRDEMKYLRHHIDQVLVITASKVLANGKLISTDNPTMVRRARSLAADNGWTAQSVSSECHPLTRCVCDDNDPDRCNLLISARYAS